MPISLVRRETVYDIRPKSPIAATSIASPPKSVQAWANSFSSWKRFSTCSSCVDTSIIGRALIDFADGLAYA